MGEEGGGGGGGVVRDEEGRSFRKEGQSRRGRKWSWEISLSSYLLTFYVFMKLSHFSI